jgi:hypothetical protein
MKSKNRIFLKTNTEIREFLWLQQGGDGSIYLGSASKFRYGRKGLLHASENDDHGTPLNFGDGQTMAREELAGKLSFHKSGIVNLPTISVDRRNRLRVRTFSEYEGALPLLCVLPMVPTRYPLSNKKVKTTDLVIDCGINQGKCIGIVLFVAFNEPNRDLFANLRKQGLSVYIVSVDIFDWKLCAMLYFNDRFYGWPAEQMDGTPHPDNAGVMPWPILVPKYAT